MAVLTVIVMTETEFVIEADASFSEQQIATLLAPLNFNTLNATGGKASLNEYAALFDKSESRSTVSTTYNSANDFYLLDTTHVVKADKFGYLVNVSSIFENGSRKNSFGQRYELKMLGQYQPTYKDRVMLEGTALFAEDQRWSGFREEDNLTETDTTGSSPVGDYLRSTALTPFNLQLGYSHTFSAESHQQSQIPLYQLPHAFFLS